MERRGVVADEAVYSFIGMTHNNNASYQTALKSI